AEPESDLARAIQDLSTELMAQDLPDPQAEWDDALRAIERQAVQDQCDRLIASGLATAEDRRRYQELSRRLARRKAGAGGSFLASAVNYMVFNKLSRLRNPPMPQGTGTASAAAKKAAAMKPKAAGIAPEAEVKSAGATAVPEAATAKKAVR